MAFETTFFVPFVQVAPFVARGKAGSQDTKEDGEAKAHGVAKAGRAEECGAAMAANEEPHMAMAASTVEEQVGPSLDATVTAPFLFPRSKLTWWEKNATAKAADLIRNGVQPGWLTPPDLPIYPTLRDQHQNHLANDIIKEYLDLGAVKKVPFQGTKFLVPWFVIEKQDETQVKRRLICDCRKINDFLQPKHFHLDHWKDIFPHLKQGMFATKIDLKNAYFHLELHPDLKPYVRLQVGNDIYEFQSACFGLSTLPQLWMEIMTTFLRLWHRKGIRAFIYLDDILILGENHQDCQKATLIAQNDLLQAGLQINMKKSCLNPQQQISHLGFQIDFQQGLLKVPPHKLKALRKDLGKVLCRASMTCQKCPKFWAAYGPA